MELQASVLEAQSDLLVADDVMPLCELARNLEEAGEFESAMEILKPFWKGPIERPNTRELEQEPKAELLLRTGTLTGWLGSARQIPGAQEAAKDLVSESAAIYAALGLDEKVAEARVDLAICYWREGALDEARVTLRHVLDSLGQMQSEQRLRALLNSAIVEKVATRDREALRIYREAAPLFDASSNHALKGKFHNSHAILLKGLGLSEKREEYIDQALVEFAAASYHFEKAGHQRFQAVVENNVGFLFGSINRFSEGQAHLNRARRLMLSLGDHGAAALFDDARAQVFMLEGRNQDAEKVARGAVQALRLGGEQTHLAEALTTHAKALARLNQHQSARTSFDQALEIAQNAGDPDRGGVAAVSVIEELGNFLSGNALQEYYRTAESLLANSQDHGIRTRLGEC